MIAVTRKKLQEEIQFVIFFVSAVTASREKVSLSRCQIVVQIKLQEMLSFVFSLYLFVWVSVIVIIIVFIFFTVVVVLAVVLVVVTEKLSVDSETEDTDSDGSNYEGKSMLYWRVIFILGYVIGEQAKRLKHIHV